jgi:hypothetical protein
LERLLIHSIYTLFTLPTTHYLHMRSATLFTLPTLPVIGMCISGIKVWTLYFKFIPPLAFERATSIPPLHQSHHHHQHNVGPLQTRFVRAFEWKGDIRIDIRDYQVNVPTKKGISLTLGRWKIWAESTENIDKDLSKGSAYSGRKQRLRQYSAIQEWYCTHKERNMPSPR